MFGEIKKIILMADMHSNKKCIINIILSIIGIGIVLFYGICGGTCSYLKGALFGIDLKYAGFFYMIIIIIMNILKRNFFVLLSVSFALGIEVYLIGFQITYYTFCPFCLAFGIIIIGQFILNFNWSKKWYIISCIGIGFFFFFFFFKGSVIPIYDFGRLNNQFASIMMS
jgi:hypothetical protein